MFVTDPNLTELRQGDILQGVFCPVVTCGSVEVRSLATTVGDFNLRVEPVSEDRQGRQVYTAQMKAIRGFAMVLSQCCDLEPRKSGSLSQPAVVIAPLRLYEGEHLTPEETAKRIESNRVIGNAIGRMFVPEKAPLPYAGVVDFSVLTSVEQSEYVHLLKSKVLQLSDEWRLILKDRFGIVFTRLTKEEEALAEAMDAATKAAASDPSATA